MIDGRCYTLRRESLKSSYLKPEVDTDNNFGSNTYYVDIRLHDHGVLVVQARGCFLRFNISHEVNV